MKTITVQELQALAATETPLDILDVRTPAEYVGGHVPGAQNYPLDALDCGAALAQRQADIHAPLYLLCHAGTRAKKAAARFAEAGFSETIVVEGGTQAWVDAGLPVERTGKAVLPLDRQLQLAIGTLVLAGVLLAHFVNPAWIWLSGFAGAGLIFAGLSGICLMRSLIARMPWNQAGKSNGCCCGGSCCSK